jgi:Rieske Fe-S protein
VEFTHVGKTLMVTRVSESEVAAFSSQCPHAGYEVLPPEHGVLHCASGHGGSFDLTGRVKSGPARSDLERYPAELLNNSVFISYPF